MPTSTCISTSFLAQPFLHSNFEVMALAFVAPGALAHGRVLATVMGTPRTATSATVPRHAAGNSTVALLAGAVGGFLAKVGGKHHRAGKMFLGVSNDSIGAAVAIIWQQSGSVH